MFPVGAYTVKEFVYLGVNAVDQCTAYSFKYQAAIALQSWFVSIVKDYYRENLWLRYTP